MNPIQSATLTRALISNHLVITFRNGFSYGATITDSNTNAPSTYVVNVPGEIGTVELTVYWSSANIFCYSRRERRSYEFRFSVSTDSSSTSSSTTDYSVRSGGINIFSEYIFADTHEQYWRDDSGYRDTNTANLRNNMRVTPEDGSLIREFKSRKKIKRNLPEWF